MQDQEEVEETPAERTERYERNYLGKVADILSDRHELDSMLLGELEGAIPDRVPIPEPELTPDNDVTGIDDEVEEPLE
jgi:hypothetical protein